MVQPDDPFVFEVLPQDVAAHYFARHAEDVSALVNELNAAAFFMDGGLREHNLRLQAVQLAAEQDARVSFGHQHIPMQMGHMLRLFREKSAGLIVDEFCGGRRLLGRRRSRLFRLGGFWFSVSGRLPFGDLDFALLQILPRCGGQDLPLRDVINLRLRGLEFQPQDRFRDDLQTTHPLGLS